jgi:tetrapyrrole methylase family protein/MazG family protein
MPASDFSRAQIEAVADPAARLRVLMKRLLDPGGCPWDREQTHETLKQYLIEEAYEVCEAIDGGDNRQLCEELGDVALQVIFHAELAERAGRFRLEEVYEAVCWKLLDRHPHVFGDVEANDAQTVLKNWEQIKTQEKRRKADPDRPASALDGVPGSLPALQRARRLQEKASRVGFDWDCDGPVKGKVLEEIGEFFEALEKGDHQRQTDEFGDLLFSLVNLSRFVGVEPEEALRRTCAKFIDRFRQIEQAAACEGRDLNQMSLEEMDLLWERTKGRS